MNSLESIEASLRERARALGMKGDYVELLISLLSYNRYSLERSHTTALLESLPETAVNINSLITHAGNEMYSTYRGRNSMVSIPVEVTGTVRYDMFQEVYSGSVKLFYIGFTRDGVYQPINHTFQVGKKYTLHLMKASTLVRENLYYDPRNPRSIECIANSVSEMYRLVPLESTDLPLKTTKDFFTHIDDTNQDPVNKIGLNFDLTLPGYGVRFYSSNPDGFPSMEYQLQYFPFDEVNLQFDKIASMKLPGLELDIIKSEIEPVIPRENLSNLTYNLKRNTVTQHAVRSNTDVLDSFKKFFTSKVSDVQIRDYDIQKNLLTLVYLTHRGEETEEVTKEELTVYIDSLMYYVTTNIVINKMADKDAIKVDLKGEIMIDRNVNPRSVNEVIRNYHRKFGVTLNKYELIGKINEIPGIKYVSMTASYIKGIEPSKEFEVLECEKYEFLNIENQFKYINIK